MNKASGKTLLGTMDLNTSYVKRRCFQHTEKVPN